MQPIRKTAKNASTRASNPATAQAVRKLENPGDQSPEIPYGGNLRDDIERVIKGDFDFKGKIALSETFKTTPVPALHVDGIGLVGSPLSERDAKLIEATATQPPFRKGTKTVVDTSVKDTFEINPDKFSLKNPAWTEFLNTVTKKVATGLSLPPNLPPPRAELYKLLLYKTGSHVLPHKDTEKSQGMFASLIIVLPSKFEGGEVHVSHGNDKNVFNISPSSEFTTSALAWYTDVTHEVKPVTSGYRLAISYNLVNTSPGIPPPHLPNIHSAVLAVEKIFKKWKKGGCNEPKFSGNIAYLLDHEYSDASLEFAALKGKDATLVSSIRGVAEKQGISLRLGLLECQAEEKANKYGSHCRWSSMGMQQIHGKKFRIKGLYDLEGDFVSGGKPIVLNPKFDMIPQDPGFQGRDPYDEEFVRYAENESATTYWYHCSVLVMSLGGGDSEISLKTVDAKYALKKLQRWKTEGPTERSRQMAQFLLDHGNFDVNWSRKLSEDGALLVDLALEWDDFAMWQEVLKKSTSDKRVPELGSDVLVRACGAFTFDRTKHIIEQALRNRPNTKAAVELIRAFRERAPTQDPNVAAWWKQQMTPVLSSITPAPSVGDAPTFVYIAESEGLPFFSQTIVKQLVKFSGLFSFWIELAEGLWKSKDKLTLSGRTAKGKSTTSLSRIVDSLIIAAMSESRQPDPYGSYYLSTHASTGPQYLARALKLLDLMALTNRTHHSGELITSLSKQEENLLVKYKRDIAHWIPQLKARYQQYNDSGSLMLDALLRALMERWLQDLLGNPSDAVVKMLTCPCEDCKSINEFLRSDDVTETFRAHQARRSHMESNIKSRISSAVTFTTIASGSPHSLQVTKTRATWKMDGWNVRVESARAFLSLVGTPDDLARIMGDRYQDIQAALSGTKAYKVGESPVVAPAENARAARISTGKATASRAQVGPVMAGTKRKAEDEGDMIDLT